MKETLPPKMEVEMALMTLFGRQLVFGDIPFFTEPIIMGGTQNTPHFAPFCIHNFSMETQLVTHGTR